MQRTWATAVRFGRNGMESLLVLAAVVGLWAFGRDAPVGIAAAVLLVAAISQHIRMHRSVRQRELADASLRRSEERLRALVRDGTEVIVEARADGGVTYVSPAAFPVLGYRPEDLRGRVLAGLVHADDRLAAAELHARLLAGDGSSEHTAELRIRRADGDWRWHEVIARNMLGHPEVRALIVHYRDITERRAAQDRIAYAAAHDGLTGLANSPTVARDLERALAHGTRYQHPVGMLFLDLDGFKQVNDTFGHDVGDRLLKAVADVVRKTVRDTDTVGRLGGDEFGVVLTRVAGSEEALAVAARIIDGITRTATVGGLRFDVGCSVGVALANPGGSDASTLLRHADAAMYRSKRRGRNGAQMYVAEDTTAPWL